MGKVQAYNLLLHVNVSQVTDKVIKCTKQALTKSPMSTVAVCSSGAFIRLIN